MGLSGKEHGTGGEDGEKFSLLLVLPNDNVGISIISRVSQHGILKPKSFLVVT